MIDILPGKMDVVYPKMAEITLVSLPPAPVGFQYNWLKGEIYAIIPCEDGLIFIVRDKKREPE